MHFGHLFILNELFEIFSKYKFGRESEEDAEESYRYILECDMLIIDDLGTELNNSFVSSQLFTASMSASAEKGDDHFPRTCPWAC